MNNELDAIIPEILNDIFESLEYEGGGLFLDKVDFNNKSTELFFTLELAYENYSDLQEWKLIVENCIDLKLDFDEIGEYFQFYDKHFLLVEFNDTKTDLYIKKKSINPDKMFSELTELHYSKYENLFGIDKFIINKNLLNRCKMDYGFFSSGPRLILDEYFNILKRFETYPYFYESDLRQKTTKYKLCLLGKNYFIGTSFRFEKL